MADPKLMQEAPWSEEFAAEPRKVGSGRTLLVVLLAVGGGVFLLGALGGCALVVLLQLSSRSGPPVVGRWEMLQPAIGAKVTFEFRANKTGVIKAQGAEWEFDYTLSKDDPPILEWRITSIGGGARHAFKKPAPIAVAPQADIKLDVNGAVLVGAVTEQFRVTFDNNGLLTLDNDNRPLPFKLRRLRPGQL
jgi:hypothetical protein